MTMRIILSVFLLSQTFAFYPSEEPSAMSYEPSAMSYEPSAMSYEPSAMSYEPSAMSYEPSAMSYEPSAMSYEPSAMSYEPSAMSYEPSAMSYEPSTMSYPRPTSFAFPSPHPSAVSYPGQENCGDTPNYCEMYGDLGSTCDKTDPTMPYCSTTSCSDDSDCSAPNNLCETSYSFNCVPTCIGEHPLFCARRHHNALLLCSDSGQYRGLCSYRDCWGIHGECGASFVCGQESENYGKCTATLCGDDGDCEPGDWCDNYNYCSPGPTNTFPSKTLSTSPTSFAFPSQHPSTSAYPRPTSFAFPSPHPSAVSYPGQENCGDTPNYCEMYGDLGSTCDKTDPTMPYCSTTSCSDDSDCSAPNNLCETSYSFNCVPTCIGEHPLFCARRHHNALLLCSDSGQYRGLCSYRDCWGI
eukprot:412968_1